ncbi:MAG TPA: hypothetical protein GX497_03315 [Bacillus bacterium]|nr:hypothetical protein [Bacillus sp. (in: firmicutes)]
MTTKENVIPAHLANDRYWRGTLYLFQNHYRLNQFLTTKYFDFNEETIKMQSLKRAFAPFSNSEKIMLDLALHLFNERNKFNLSQLDYLDSNNTALALKAISLRFNQ